MVKELKKHLAHEYLSPSEKRLHTMIENYCKTNGLNYIEKLIAIIKPYREFSDLTHLGRPGRFKIIDL